MSQLDLNEYIHGYSSPSQLEFEYSSHFQTVFCGGVGCGKNHSLNKRAIMLSTSIPDNEGLIARYHATELETTTKHQFFEEIPEELILERNKGEDYVIIKTGDPQRPSKIWFRHMHEPKKDKTHLSGMNLGWMGGDQIEDWEEGLWKNIMARFRRSAVRRRYMFGIKNPKGHNWTWRKWIQPAERSGNVQTVLVPSVTGGLVESRRYHAGPGVYAIVAKTEENFFNGRCRDHEPTDLRCNACLVEAADYVQKLRANQPAAWVKRMVDSGFDDWVGKIYPEYSDFSIHNIHPFPIPAAWETIVSVDVGGDVPWGIQVSRVDPMGDVFITNEFYEPGVLVGEVAKWIKDPKRSGIPDWKTARKILDPENKPVAMEFAANHQLYFEVAQKHGKVASIMQAAGYMHRVPGRVKTIPGQPGPNGIGSLIVTDAPRVWVFNTCENWRREHDAWQWKPPDPVTGDSVNEPMDKDDHLCFVAGTQISTPSGPMPVEDVRVGDLVDTPLGPRPVLHTMEREAQVVELGLSDGRTLRCTTDHPLFTAYGYRPASRAVGYKLGDNSWIWSVLWKCLRSQSNHETRSSSFAGTATTAAAVTGRGPQTGSASMWRFGKRTLARVLQATMSITSTRTAPITSLRTWNSNPSPSTWRSICPSQTGSASQPQTYCEPQSRLRRLIGRLTRRSTGQATAKRVSHPALLSGWSAPVHAGLRFLVAATHRIASARVATIASGNVATVYNIAVAEVHAYYANGVLVSNCDANLYTFRILPPVHLTPAVDPELEALKALDDRSYREALHRLAGAGKLPDTSGGMGEMFHGTVAAADYELSDRKQEKIEW